jgi:hypothetical protein
VPTDEARKLARRIAKAERRLARGVNVREERGGTVSEEAIKLRLQRLKEMSHAG